MRASFGRKGLILPWLFFLSTLGALAMGDADSRGNINNPYDLFDPVPEAFMRSMVSDRPDITEAPYTVDPGHFQFETDLFKFTQNKVGGVTTQDFGFNFLNLKWGITMDIDFQVIVESYRKVITKIGSTTLSNRGGFGDTTIRIKWNLVGNDRGKFGLALLPFAKLPTNSNSIANGQVEGGILIPFATELPDGWSLGWMFGPLFEKNSGNTGYHLEFLSTFVVSKAIIEDVYPYLEFVSESSAEPGAEWSPSLSFGTTYWLSKTFVLDVGGVLGLTEAATDFTIFTGLSFRI